MQIPENIFDDHSSEKFQFALHKLPVFSLFYVFSRNTLLFTVNKSVINFTITNTFKVIKTVFYDVWMTLLFCWVQLHDYVTSDGKKLSFSVLAVV